MFSFIQKDLYMRAVIYAQTQDRKKIKHKIENNLIDVNQHSHDKRKNNGITRKLPKLTQRLSTRMQNKKLRANLHQHRTTLA
jgi:hypothetical protein